MIPAPSINTGQTSVPTVVVAPIGGLNGRDGLAAMDPQDAYLLDNFLPAARSVELRKGCKKFSTTALAGPVQSLEVYSGAAGDTMLAWAGGRIYSIATTGIATQLATGLLGNVVVTTMFSNLADNSQHLIIVNGLDTPRVYNGALSTLTITGMTGSSSTLNFVFSFKGRLYFGQKDKIGFYYLPVGQIQGALSYFDLGQVSRLGGYLIAIASFSEGVSGENLQDYIVFITSKGECIVYAGHDPDGTPLVDWAIVGRYFAAEPIGPKCTINFGGELIILTKEGAIPFTEIRRSGSYKAGSVANAEYAAITSKLGTFLEDYVVNAAVPGWSGIQYSGLLLLNVPATSSISGAYYHYVMNTTTNAWARITNWNGLCFTVFRGKLYFGRYDGYVMSAFDGGLDDGAAIRCDCKTAYNYFDGGQGMGSILKHFQWASLLVASSNSPPQLSGRFNVDFREDQPDYSLDSAAPIGSPWDTTKWDTGMWSEESNTQRFIVTLNKGGSAGSLWLRGVFTDAEFEWFATQYVMERTRSLLI